MSPTLQPAFCGSPFDASEGAPAGAAPVPPLALQVAQVLHHVAAMLKASDAQAAIDRLADTARTCGLLLASRRQLFIALNTHQAIDRVAQLAQGREQARLTLPEEHEALRAVQAAMQVSVNDAIAHWRRTGQGFTRLTHLLPTQLDQQLTLPPALTPQQHRALVASFVRSGSEATAERFDAALGAYMTANRRCQARVGPALAARERRFRAELDGRTGQASLSAQALAMFDEFLSRQSLLVAEGERAGAHHELHLLIGLPGFWRSAAQGT